MHRRCFGKCGKPRLATIAMAAAAEVLDDPNLLNIVLSAMEPAGLLVAAAVSPAWLALTGPVWRAECRRRWPATARLPGVTSWQRLFFRLRRAEIGPKRESVPKDDLSFMVHIRCRTSINVAQSAKWLSVKDDAAAVLACLQEQHSAAFEAEQQKRVAQGMADLTAEPDLHQLQCVLARCMRDEMPWTDLYVDTLEATHAAPISAYSVFFSGWTTPTDDGFAWEIHPAADTKLADTKLIRNPEDLLDLVEKKQVCLSITAFRPSTQKVLVLAEDADIDGHDNEDLLHKGSATYMKISAVETELPMLWPPGGQDGEKVFIKAQLAVAQLSSDAPLAWRLFLDFQKTCDSGVDKDYLMTECLEALCACAWV